KDSVGMIDKKMSELMTPNPKTINENVMIVEAEEQMLRDKITLLVVTDNENALTGVLEIYDR
ncbi:MAG: CBS domain-containing protein, partial [Marinomonas sp.]